MRESCYNRLLLVFGLFLTAFSTLLALDAQPAATAADWLSDPETAAGKANDLAKHTATMSGIAWGSIIGGVFTFVALMRQYGQFIPYVGPAWKVVWDGIWLIGQHKEARLADKAQANVAALTLDAKQAIRLLRNSPGIWNQLPAQVRNPLEVLEQA